MTIKNSTILVTGGTGSFGNFITNRLLNSDVKEVRILSRDEKKQYDMRIHYEDHPKLKFFIGDIRDHVRVEEAMEGVDIVYQAAALKQVPTCEFSPMEAVKTNISGVSNIINSALRHKVKKVITVSTDKAVKPVNVMGMTKAIQERLIISANHSPMNKGTKLCCVRYGNVMRSRGSVIPFFRRQLSMNQTLSITDVGMTRFLLTLGDAIDLVIFATENTEGGETFVKKAPSAKILDLAKILSEDEGKPFNYKVIGKYPGEKLHEILITEEELQRTIDMGNYFKVNPWWIKEVFEDLKKEYSSDDAVVEDDRLVRELIQRSDEEMSKVSVEEGEFSKI
ncbi:MAG: SDR family NAD(P)-dependent oxidoreductase [Melioribacteraceae bacterium]|jgi:UDP-glucose 4-epimerase|nr:MAG: SDR family NAD(P)-dependent oxidoreductase [Melioribacteraceae bacterium]